MMNLSVFGSRLRSQRLLSASFLVALLAGCAQQAPVTQTDWQTHQYSLNQLKQYQAKGKLGYKSPELRFGANLLWQTTPEKDQLLLTNFLGSTLLKLDASAQGATLIDNQGKRHSSKDAASLVKGLTGIALPIEQMRDWLIGLPTAADTFQLNEQNTVSYLAKTIGNQTWEMEYQSYDHSHYPALPKKMILSQDQQRITLIIHSWTTK